MPDTRPTRSAQIIAFRPRSTTPDNRFTLADKMEVLRWEAADATDLRLTIFTRQDSDPPEVGEFANIYPADDRWAAWGAVRQGRRINVWRARDGRDIGHFPTMADALQALALTARG